MSREIKYRQPVFNKDGSFSHWHYWGWISEGNFVSPMSMAHNVNNIKGLQYIDIKDKNDNPIYERDVVKWNINDIVRIAPVYYDQESACFWMGIDIKNNFLVLNDWLRGGYEIIGNIYENPELVNENEN